MDFDYDLFFTNSDHLKKKTTQSLLLEGKIKF